jgi:NTP pyrophosphatase (non-canonical NTP hydrolase)
MELKQLIELQVKFDRAHGWDWSNLDSKERLKKIEYLAIALAGEIGEFCNLVKKASRRFASKGKLPTQEEWKRMEEELVDVFIYILKGAGELFGMDLEASFLEKLAKNVQRFKEFER